MDNEEFLKKLGRKIRILRNEHKLSQEALAEIAGSERAHISNIENGKANPSILYLKQIADGFNVDIRELFNFTI